MFQVRLIDRVLNKSSVRSDLDLLLYEGHACTVPVTGIHAAICATLRDISAFAYAGKI